MESEKFDLVFSGQVLPKQDVGQVKANMAALFKVSAAQIDALFSGKAVVLKRNLDLTAANRYRVAIKKAGARVDLVKSGVTPAKGAPVVPPAPAQAAEPQNIAEPAQDTTQPPEPAIAASKPAAMATPEADPQQTEVLAGDFTLASAGSDLLSEDERETVLPVAVDISSLSLRENSGNLLDEHEWQRELPIAVADLDADILPAGSDLLSTNERASVAQAEVNELQADLAPVGSRLEVEKPAPPPAPNVDHIQLVD